MQDDVCVDSLTAYVRLLDRLSLPNRTGREENAADQAVGGAGHRWN